MTQTLGWVDAWTSKPSAYAVASRPATMSWRPSISPASNNLRLVVKGGGHSYQGTSNAADSLLIWTRKMNAVTLHGAFVPDGCAGRHPPQPAVTVEAGAIWGQLYDAVTTKGGRYVQGGGCITVGVAGLIQSGGFGSFSKAYGMAAASLLRSRDRYRRRHGEDRQCLHESGPVLGDKGWRWRESRGRDTTHVADA